MTTARLIYAATDGSTYRMPATGGYLRCGGRQCMCGTLSPLGSGPTTLWRKMTQEEFESSIEAIISEQAAAARAEEAR